MNPLDAHLDTRRKRLRFRSWHRGTRELDLLRGTFADRYLSELSESELDCYEALLLEGDPDLFKWISGKVAPPTRHDTEVLQLITKTQLLPL